MFRELLIGALFIFALNAVSFCQNDGVVDTTSSADSISTLDEVRALISEAKYDSALGIVEEYLQNNNEDNEAWYLKGYVYDQKDNLALASEYYHKSIALDSTYWGPWRELAYLFDIFAQYDSMNIYLHKALETSDDPGSIYYDYGYSFDMLNQADSALIYYHKALDVDTLDYEAYLNIGAIWGLRDNLDSAKVYTSKALAINPSVPRACYNYAAILGAEGNYHSAVDYYQKALALDTTMIEVKLRLGELYEELGDSTMAQIYFQEFVDSAPMIYTDDINRTKAKLVKYK